MSSWQPGTENNKQIEIHKHGNKRQNHNCAEVLASITLYTEDMTNQTG